LVAASVFGLLICNGPIVYSFTVFIPTLVEEFGWQRGPVSLSITFHTLANAAALPFAGHLVDRFGARRVLLPAILLWGSGVGMLCLLPGKLWAFYAAFAGLGIVTSGCTPLPYGRAISAWFNKRRGLALGIAMSGVGFGTLLLPIFANYMIETYDWRAAFAGIGALICLIGLVMVFPVFRNSPEEKGLTPDGDEPVETAAARTVVGFSWREAFTTRAFWLMAIAFACVSMAVIGTSAHLVPILRDGGLSPSKAALGVSTLGISLLLGRVWAGYLMDHYFAPYVAIGAICGPILGCLLLASGTTGALAFVAAAGIGLGVGAEVDMIAYMTSRYLGLRAFGVIYGTLFGIFLIGGGVGAPLMGYGFDTYGTYTNVLIFFTCACVLACILLLRLDPYPELPVLKISPR